MKKPRLWLRDPSGPYGWFAATLLRPADLSRVMEAIRDDVAIGRRSGRLTHRAWPGLSIEWRLSAAKPK